MAALTVGTHSARRHTSRDTTEFTLGRNCVDEVSGKLFIKKSQHIWEWKRGYSECGKSFSEKFNATVHRDS